MQLPDAEFAVMEALWSRSPQTAEELLAGLGEARSWQPSTLKTLLARLVKKGALQFERDGRRFLYSPLWQREDYVLKATRTFLDTMFGGKLTPLVAHLSAHRKLKAGDRKALSALLRELEQRDAP